MNSTLTQAIQAKTIVRIRYKDEIGERLIEPFCYGRGGSDKELLRAWEISGFSNHPDDVPNWRLFIVENISSMELTDKNFTGIRPFYTPNDSAMSEVYAHI